MKMQLFWVTAFLLLFSATSLVGQTEPENLIQFSGMVLDGSDEQLFPVPYTNILVKDKNRGTYSDFKDFFLHRS